MSKKINFIMFLLLVQIVFLINVYGMVNLLKNPSFEMLDEGKVSEWKKWQYLKEDENKNITEYLISTENAKDKKKCISIVNHKKNDSRLFQVIDVEKGKKYKLSGWIKVNDVGLDNKGANLTVLGYMETSLDVVGSTEWVYRELYIDAIDDIKKMNIGIGLGGYGSMNKGIAFFDNIVLEEVEVLPEDKVIIELKNKNEKETSKNNSTDSGKERREVPYEVGVILYISGGISSICGLVVIIKYRKRGI